MELSQVIQNVFCKTGAGGGIDPTCGSKVLSSTSSAGSAGASPKAVRKVVEKSLDQALRDDQGRPSFLLKSVIYKGKRGTAQRDLHKPDTFHITIGHKQRPLPKPTGTYKGTYMRYTTVTRKGSEKIGVELE
jgi:hypothetical protein